MQVNALWHEGLWSGIKLFIFWAKKPLSQNLTKCWCRSSCFFYHPRQYHFYFCRHFSDAKKKSPINKSGEKTLTVKVMMVFTVWRPGEKHVNTGAKSSRAHGSHIVIGLRSGVNLFHTVWPHSSEEYISIGGFQPSFIFMPSLCWQLWLRALDSQVIFPSAPFLQNTIF